MASYGFYMANGPIYRYINCRQLGAKLAHRMELGTVAGLVNEIRGES